MAQTVNSRVPFPRNERERLQVLAGQVNNLLAQILMQRQKDWSEEFVQQLRLLAEAGHLVERLGEGIEPPAAQDSAPIESLHAVSMPQKTEELLRKLEQTAPPLLEQTGRMADMAWARGEESSIEFRQLEAIRVHMALTLGMLQHVIPINSGSRSFGRRGRNAA